MYLCLHIIVPNPKTNIIMAFTLPALPYPSDALEPYIDAQTMEIHHGKHHQTYINKLNEAIAPTPLAEKSIEALCAEDCHLPAVRNNGGGHWNHSFFWPLLSPTGGGTPEGSLKEAIDSSFGSFENFKERFTQAALTRFGSGWAWLCTKDNKLEICSTANQDNPLMPDSCAACVETSCKPLLGLDVWEHAYYLTYQNRRPEYVAAFFHIINWEAVAAHFSA